MRILFFTRALPCHNTGGMELVAWDVAKGLAERKHNVKIITTSTGNSIPYKIPEDLRHQLAIEYLEKTKPGRYSRRWWKDSRRAYVIEKKRFIPDVVISISAGARSVLPLLREIPAIMQAHGTSWGEFISKIHSGRFISMIFSIRNLIWIPLDLVMYHRFRKVVAVGPKVYNALEHPLVRWALPKDGMIMIPNGIDTELFRPDHDTRLRIRKKMGIPEKTKVIIWASRLHRQKGAHLALRAFSELKSPDIWFLVIGDGPERSALEFQSKTLRVADRVVFVGQVDHSYLPALLNCGDVFLFTTIREEVGFTLNVLEALSVNLPVVVSSYLAGLFEGVEGIYPVNPTDTKTVSKAIENAFLSDGSGRFFIENHYSRETMLDRYELILKEVVSSNE
jgi:glycosyltransferase involved in cell wall biosynthesis